MVELNLPLVAIVQIVAFLFPGFLALKIRDGLTRTKTEPRKPNKAWLPALLFDLPVFLFVIITSQFTPFEAFAANELSSWTIVLALIYATVIGLFAGAADEKGWLTWAIQKLHLSRKIGQSPWEKSFKASEKEGETNSWLVVHLKDGTRILGWAKYYSAESSEVIDKEIFLAKGKENGEPVKVWPSEDSAPYKVDGPGVLVTPQAEITRLEFLEGQ